MSNSSSNSNKFESFLKDKEKTTQKLKKQKNFSENMDLFIFKNVKQLSMGLVEFTNNTLFHGLDTLKVRVQAKCMVEDVALFYKNKVQLKRKYNFPKNNSTLITHRHYFLMKYLL
jgi:hypothetical protein